MTGASSIRRAVFLFLAPALLPILVFFFLPAVAAFAISFTDFDIYSLGDFRNARFVGFKNYIQLFDDTLFWKAMKNTLYYVLVGGPLSVAVSLAAALLVNARLARFRGFFRTVYFAPVVTTLVAVAIVWRYMYHPRFGILNYALNFFGIDPVDWLGDPLWAMPAIILLSVWKGFGYNMIIFVAGLQSIPGELYEAARIDGAGWWQQFKRITLPMLAPTSVFIGIVTMINNFQLFAEPYVMTQGGPVHSTLSIVLLMYEQGFRWWNMGYSAAIAFVLFGIILVVSLAQSKLQKQSAL
ncbi:MAG: sugar ABC transporter permease [Ignavibacteriales bacterium]|nr:sugar ABC transporter permease [Ignavibacteriales bacterium]